MNVENMSFEQVQSIVADFQKINKAQSSFLDEWADLSEFDK